MPSQLTRREMLATLPMATLTPVLSRAWASGKSQERTRRVAAICTVYRHNSHADVIVGKVLEGWKQDGGPGPALEIASLYVDQFPDGDLSRPLAEKHGVPMFESIADALTLGGRAIAVDGVLSIGEHGDYPWSEKGQHLYPRRRFFEEITDTFERQGRVVPVFNDKHLSTVWEDARWMYERAKSRGIPLMAGSSIPVSFRRPDVSIPMNCEIEAVVGIGYSGLDAYGFHALEFLQCFVERRARAETGVEWVQCLQGDAMWKSLEEDLMRRDLFEAALTAVPRQEDRDPRHLEGDDVALLLFQYRDGVLGALFMLSGLAQGIGVAVQVKGQPVPVACYAEERPEPRYPHFAYLLKGIERMMHTGVPSYPVERTLLTGGILDRVLTSRADGHRRLETPELAIRYQPVDYPHAPHIDLLQPVASGR